MSRSRSTSSGLPSFAIVGLRDAAVRESRERVRSAIQNSGFDFLRAEDPRPASRRRPPQGRARVRPRNRRGGARRSRRAAGCGAGRDRARCRARARRVAAASPRRAGDGRAGLRRGCGAHRRRAGECARGGATQRGGRGGDSGLPARAPRRPAAARHPGGTRAQDPSAGARDTCRRWAGPRRLARPACVARRARGRGCGRPRDPDHGPAQGPARPRRSPAAVDNAAAVEAEALEVLRIASACGQARTTEFAGRSALHITRSHRRVSSAAATCPGPRARSRWPTAASSSSMARRVLTLGAQAPAASRSRTVWSRSRASGTR